jgi:hypothetical protein
MGNKFEQALQTLGKYYGNYVSKMADDIVEKSSELQRPYLGHGEELVDRYGHQLLLLRGILCELKSRARPAARPEMKVEQLRCPQDALASALADWFKKHPSVALSHMEIIQDKDDCLCVLVYAGGAPRDHAETDCS